MPTSLAAGRILALIELIQLVKDMTTNAPVERGAEWLRRAQLENPDIAARFSHALDTPVAELLDEIVALHWVCKSLTIEPARSNALRYLTNLQFYLSWKIQ